MLIVAVHAAALGVEDWLTEGQCSWNASKAGSCTFADRFANVSRMRERMQKRHCRLAGAHPYATTRDVLRTLESELSKQLGGKTKKHMEGHSKDDAGEAWLQMVTELGINKPLRICEVGLDAGHSAVRWLCAFPEATLVSFDLFEHNASHIAAGFLSRSFPGRFRVVGGDTRNTLPAANHVRLNCDIISIDGGHTEEVARNDINRLRPHASTKHALLIDDVRCAWWLCRDPTRVWVDAIAAGLIVEHRCEVHRCCRGWCAGRYRNA